MFIPILLSAVGLSVSGASVCSAAGAGLALSAACRAGKRSSTDIRHKSCACAPTTVTYHFTCSDWLERTYAVMRKDNRDNR